MTTTTHADLPAGAGDLIAEFSRAPLVGGNTGAWPGLTIYRFTSPVGPTWEEIQSLSLCIVAQGRMAVTVEGDTYEYDPFHYLVLNSHLHFQAEILEATPVTARSARTGRHRQQHRRAPGLRNQVSGLTGSTAGRRPEHLRLVRALGQPRLCRSVYRTAQKPGRARSTNCRRSSGSRK
jgi:hypothetical protein